MCVRACVSVRAVSVHMTEHYSVHLCACVCVGVCVCVL